MRSDRIGRIYRSIIRIGANTWKCIISNRKLRLDASQEMMHVNCEHTWKVVSKEKVDYWTGWEVLVDTRLNLVCAKCGNNKNIDESELRGLTVQEEY